MATYRQVYTSFWQDPFVTSLTPEEKYFYLYLITNPKTNICGIYELSIKIAEVETGYNRETIEKLIKKFENDYHKVKFSSKTSEICIINWFKYNINKSPKVKIAIEESLNRVKNKELIRYLYGIDTVSFATVYVTDPITDSIIELNTNTKVSEITEKEDKDLFKTYAAGDQELFEAFKEFENMRKKIRKPLTNYAKRLICGDLDKLAKQGNNRLEVINQSIRNSWQSLYPIKRGETNGTYQKSDEPTKPKYEINSTKL